MGARIFNIWDAAEDKEVKISVFEIKARLRELMYWFSIFPYPADWDSIGLNLMTYYVKRCVALRATLK